MTSIRNNIHSTLLQFQFVHSFKNDGDIQNNIYCTIYNIQTARIEIITHTTPTNGRRTRIYRHFFWIIITRDLSMVYISI